MKIVQTKLCIMVLFCSQFGEMTLGFSVQPAVCSDASALHMTNDDTAPTKKSENKAMAFLRKIGKVGGTANQDFMNSVGVDEGPAGKTSAGRTKTIRKAMSAYIECTKSGVVDDLTEPFPITSSGTEWAGVTDRVMGGMSSGSITREVIDGKTANVLRGNVSLASNGGFVQMATNLALDPSIGVVDASDYDGLELDVLCQGTHEMQNFNVHLKTKSCQRQFSSYRGTFEISRGTWQTVRLPWSEFKGKGPGAEDATFDPSSLRRLGVVAIGKEMDVYLAVSGVRFYSVL